MREVTNVSDATKRYITYSTGMGNYTSSINTTGSSSNYAVKNIYDMAGNVLEWTMEAQNTNTRAIRSGIRVFGTDYPPCSRSGALANSSVNNVGFRLALYIK